MTTVTHTVHFGGTYNEQGLFDTAPDLPMDALHAAVYKAFGCEADRIVRAANDTNPR